MLKTVAAPYSGQKCRVHTTNLRDPDDRVEIWLFARQLLSVLYDAGWRDFEGRKFDFSVGVPVVDEEDSPYLRGMSGVLIETAPEAPPQTQAAAEALTKALKSIGVFARHEVGYEGLAPVDRDRKTYPIVITVGPRL